MLIVVICWVELSGLIFNLFVDELLLWYRLIVLLVIIICFIWLDFVGDILCVFEEVLMFCDKVGEVNEVVINVVKYFIVKKFKCCVIKGVWWKVNILV